MASRGASSTPPLIAATPGLEVAAIVTGRPARVAQARADFPHAEIVADTPSALSGPELFDLAVVATPNEYHVPIALQCIAARNAVVVDKPLASSWQDASRLARRAVETGVLLSVFQNRRYDGDFLTLRDVVGGGRLGRVNRFESRFERWRPTVEPARWREDPDPARAGGLLFELGSHMVDQALLLFGPPRQVYAELDSRRRGGSVDDDVFVAITHGGGMRSHLFASSLAAQPGPRFRVLGNLAGYTKYGLDVQEAQLAAGLRPGDEGWGVGDAGDDGVLGTGREEQRVVTRAGSYEAFYAEMAGALDGRCAVPVDPHDAVATLRVIGAARDAATSRRVVEFDERPMSP